MSPLPLHCVSSVALQSAPDGVAWCMSSLPCAGPPSLLSASEETQDETTACHSAGERREGVSYKSLDSQQKTRYIVLIVHLL